MKRLHLLARLHGLQLRYWDVFGQRRCPGPDAIVAVLAALGVVVEDAADVDAAIDDHRRRRWRRLVEPVSVLRGGASVLRLRLPSPIADERIRCDIVAEDGEARAWTAPLQDVEPLAGAAFDSDAYVLKHLVLPNDLAHGYHRCSVDVGGRRAETLIVAAPDTAPTPADLMPARSWGAFLPLYALRSDGDWGIGDFGDLAAMADWIADCGGNVVSTLPLLPTDSASLAGSSPYSPVSRLFWSEQFVDLRAVPELQACASAEPLVRSASARRRLEALHAGNHVEYAEIDALKRTLLIDMASAFFSAPAGPRHDRFRSFLERRPEVDSYARFRATLQRQGRAWSDWPTPLRDGTIGAQDHDESVYRSHLYGQWLADQQLADTAREMERRGVTLYLDLPLGVPGDSFDAWSHREQFANGVSAGAPPDTFFLRGQNWALGPLHPERSREHGHDYLRACLRHHLRAAGMLRIDHVMALHRLFWVPAGFPATEGVYVRYPAQELWAILALESQRHQAVVVGEDLGTVPRAVRRAMRRNRAHRIFVVQTEIAEDRLPCLDPPTPDSIACMNTHDMPTFASYWRGADVRDLGELGILDEEAMAAEAAHRADKLRVLTEFLRHGGWLEEGAEQGDGAETLRACLRFLADSDAFAVIVNLEDLWLEELPQNVPGTSRERPNWQRRARHSLEQIQKLAGVADVFDDITRRRRQAGGRSSDRT